MTTDLNDQATPKRMLRGGEVSISKNSGFSRGKSI